MLKNKITVPMSICPYKKLINLSIKEKSDKVSTKYGIHVDAKTNANVNIPAIIGDSVRLDAKIPKEMYTHDSNKNPNAEVK